MKIASLSSAILSVASAVSASRSIAVYEVPGRHSDVVPFVSMKSALLYLADKFGAGEYYSIGHKDAAVEFIDHVHEKETGKPDLLVILKGVDNPEQMLEGWAPTFEIDAGKHDKAAHELVRALFKKLPKQIADVQQAPSVAHLTEEIKYVNAQNDVLSRQFQQFNDELPQAWDSLFGKTVVIQKGQHVMGASSSELKLVNDKLYISELMQMVKLSSNGSDTGAFLVANFDSLHSIGHRIGYGSRTYSVAKGALLESIKTLASAYDVTIVAMGTEHKIATEESQLLKRASALDTVFSTFAKRGTSAAKSCFASEDACNSATGSCSGHGACMKVQNQCWQCLCSATQDAISMKTTKWAGYDCSKKDIAAQAHLLLWTSVALLATLVGGIKLLFGVGSDALPGVLQAATIDTSR